VDAGDPVVLEDTSNTLVWLRPAPVVARVAALTAVIRPDGGESHLRREVEVTTHLAAAGAPVVGPSDVLPAGPHERDGRWMTFWPHIDHDTSRAVAIEEAAASLDQVHGALAGYSGDLPFVAPVLVEVPRIVEALVEREAVTPADANALGAAWSRLAPQLEALGPAQPLHGDAHVGNMLVPRGGDPLWSDFEDACTGPTAWDMACLRYHSSVFEPAVRDPAFATCLEARGLQSTVWTCLLAQQLPEFASRAEARLALYRAV
jgi:hypothetical protein